MDDTFPVKFEGGSYDLKNFMRDHPGGVNTLKVYKGKSIRNAMLKFGHSASAYHMLNDLKLSGEPEDANLTGQLSGNGRIITNGEGMLDVEEIAFLEELEGRVDWSKPIVNQIHVIAPHYKKWVNTAVYRDCRFFANPVLEALSFTPWYLVPIFWIPIITYLAVTQYASNVDCGDSGPEGSISPMQFLYHIALGALTWSALEYSLHRWVFHLDPGSSLTMMKIHFVIHGAHHKVPFDSYRQVFPPFPAVLITYFLHNLLSPFWSRPMIKLIGGLAGYLTYDMIHLYVHHGSPKDGTYLYMMKRYHSNHHFVNHDKAFGISSKLWDYVFRTVTNVKKLSFSLSWNT